MILRRLRTITAAVILLFMLGPTAISANGGPMYEPADGHGLLRLDEGTNVSLVREKVSFTIKNEANKYDRQADVSIQYELKNNNKFQKDIDVLFLTPTREVLTVTEGDKRIESSLTNDAKTLNWHAGTKMTVTDPVSGKELRIHSYGDSSNETTGTRFYLSFEPNETKRIDIHYTELGGMYDKGVISTIFSRLYYLTPAKFWEGKPQVELEVNLNNPDLSFHSNLPMEKTGPATYYASFKDLPGEEWYFSYTNPGRLLFPTNIESEHNLLILLTTLILTALAAGAALLLRRSWILMISSIGIMFFTVYYITKMGGYPFNPIFVGFTDVVVGVVLIVCNIVVFKRIRNASKKAVKTL